VIDRHTWLATHAGVFDDLDPANVELPIIAGASWRFVTRTEASAETHDALSEIGDKAAARLTCTG
jgi:hypothetical protein